jgi:hypothetical protein
MRDRVVVFGVLFTAVLFAASPSPAQTAYRLKGTTQTGDTPVAATVSAEATVGFRGEQFTGQKAFSVQANEKGEWNLLGLTAGVWVFVASAPDRLPAVAVLPIKFAQRQMQSAQGGQLNWALPLELLPADEHPLIKAAAPLVTENRALEAVQSLSAALLPDARPSTQCAAGQMALAIKQTGLARQLFQSVQKADPKNGCAPVGLASVALLLNDWDTASKMFWTAREMLPRDQRPAIAAAITELQQIARIQ